MIAGVATSKTDWFIRVAIAAVQSGREAFRQHVFSFATKTAKRHFKEAKATIEPAESDRRPIGPNLQNANTDRTKGSSEKRIPKAISGGGYAKQKCGAQNTMKKTRGIPDAQTQCQR
jgi:hypothetical protein